MANRVQNLFFLLVLSTGAYFASGHVALTFPPARKYDLDFLDNSRTPAPCGVPKGKQIIFIISLSINFYCFMISTFNKTKNRQMFKRVNHQVIDIRWMLSYESLTAGMDKVEF